MKRYPVFFSSSLLFLSALLMFFTSCYKSPNVEIAEDEMDIILTNYSNDIDYPNEYNTYYIGDSFGLATNIENLETSVINNPEFRNNVKTIVQNNMNEYGYVQWDSTQSPKPDIFIAITISYIDMTGIDYYPIFWGGSGYSYGYPHYGFNGYYYYDLGYVPGYYNYALGSMMIDWIDIKNQVRYPPDTAWYAENIYNMGISGVVENAPPSSLKDRLTAAIEQGFRQSGYLKK